MGLAGIGAVAFSALSEPGEVRREAAAAAQTYAVHIGNMAFDGTPEPPTPTPSPTPTPVPTRPASAEGLRFWSDGDSTSYFVTVALFALVSEQGGIPVRAADYKISSGLRNVAFFDWATYIASEMALYDPDVAVFMVGANDAMGISDYADYAARAGAIMDLMHRPGRTVLWMGQPNMQPDPGQGYNPALAARIPPLNEVFRAEAAKRDWVIYVDTWSVTSWSDGTYAPALPDASGASEVLRASDGIHFTPAGGRRLAQAALAALFGP